MNLQNKIDPVSAGPASPRDWVQILSSYRDPSTWRSLFELAVTIIPYLALWALAWWSLSYSYLLAVLIAVANGAFLVRLFTIQHDCGHRAFFKSKHAEDWVGRVIGALTLTPYDVWKRVHAIHHSAHGNLDRRGMGDIHTMTVREYSAQSAWGKFMYRLYRNPIVLFGLGPAYLFYIQNRVPVGLMKQGRYWTSAMLTNLAIAVILGVIIYFGGLMPVVLIFLPTTVVGASIGLWLFYIQHQFENAHWDEEPNWQLHDAALHGSSHYVMPKILQWLSANIGIHHVHHLYSRIPFYRLTEVLRDHPALENAQRMTIPESFKCVKLQLWDEDQRRLLTHAQARALYGSMAA